MESWQYSLETGILPPSHSISYLRLIPKTDKDGTKLSNWRPITLSNCDHKLITRVYNKRLLAILGKHIIQTQTAYIKQRNITDNIRMIKSAIQLANHERHINGSVIALDAQKAFDSISHQYLAEVLDRVGLNNFNPILSLLYRNLKNDIIVNGEVKGRHSVTNGVKQGDALSCTLFILGIEPLIRNIQNNNQIVPIKSRTLQYEWPKVFGYADDITCVVLNNDTSKQQIFTEYERFTKFAGLKLNADKTEIYCFDGNNRVQHGLTNITYLEENVNIIPKESIKVNGIELCQNLRTLRRLNAEKLLAKMDRHFKQWAKRHLSLLGKVQIYKTFGLSQFLYHLSVFEPDTQIWKEISVRINKFMWNRNYQGNQAPHRIKKRYFITT